MKPALTPARLSSATEIASAAFEVPILALLGRQRQKPIARARQALYAGLYRGCETSYPEIGRLLDRDNATVLYGVHEAEAAAADPDYAERLARIVAACRA